METILAQQVAETNILQTIVCYALFVYNIILIARLLFSWFPQIPDGLRPIYSILFALTEPVLRLARPLIPPLRTGMGAMDLSPLLVFVVLIILRTIVCG